MIKNQELADTNMIKKKLFNMDSNKPDGKGDLFDYCGAMLSKNKLKHFCKKVGHSRIISKMASLQKLGGQDGNLNISK